MTDRRLRYRTSDPELDRRIDDLLAAAGARENRDQLFEILVSGVRLAGDDADRLDLKIANAALKEMRNAFRAFAPYRDIPKVTMFGSARTRPDDPLYAQAREMARVLAEKGWMVVTGAGPGIMHAGMEGAGRDRSFGVTIRLPFEQAANPVILGDEKLVSMKYFFTRKLMLIKESSAFVSLPGGFGTLDEAFELLTLVQTGKMVPVPIVFLDVPGGTYWTHWSRFLAEEVASRGLVSEQDLGIYLVTDDVTRAGEEIVNFYAVFHSLRYVGDRLVVRLQRPVTDDELARVSEEAGALLGDDGLRRTAALPAEVADDDLVDLPRVVLKPNRRRSGSLHPLINALNRLEVAP